MKKVNVKTESKTHSYDIKIGSQLLAETGIWLSEAFANSGSKIALISNGKVYSIYGEKVRRSLESAGFKVETWLMGDGEIFKNIDTLRSALAFFSEIQITRTDAVVALGGGLFFRLPPTLLKKTDSTGGGKTAVNSEFGKNLIGSFYQPDGVLIDVLTLQTLELREVTAGFCEAIKQGAIGSQQLFDETAEFLDCFSVDSFRNHFCDEEFLRKLTDLVASQVEFKAAIVSQDEREESRRMDPKSRKILNFGHTLAHALENVTDYKYFKHGEAVGYGMLFAAELSKRLDIFDANRLNLFNDVVRRAGVLPATDNINIDEVYKAFSFDKKTFNESLHWILLKEIGKPCIYSSKDVPEQAVRQALKKVLEK